MFDTVVLATDGSPSAERAVTLALDLCGRFDAAIHVLHVRDPDESEDRAAGEPALASVTDRRPDATTAIREGDPVTEICGYAEAVGADLVAMGTRGRQGEHSFLLGSVAEGVVRRSPVPVLTARQLGHARADDPALGTE